MSILEKAGEELQKDSTDYIYANGYVKTGKIAVTDSYKLKKHGVKKIIHAVGPNYDDTSEKGDKD